MWVNHIRRAALAAGMAIAFAGTANAQEFQVPMTAEFNEQEIQFSGGVAAPFVVRWNFIAHQGQLALCGSGFLRDARFNATIRGMARNGSVEIDGREVPVNLTYFTRARSANDLRTRAATCRVVGPLPTGNGSIYFSYGAGNLRN